MKTTQSGRRLPLQCGATFRWFRLLALCFLFFGSAGSAWAACTSPETATVAPGGSVKFTCAQFGFNSPAVQDPSNGTLTFNNSDNSLTYTNTNINASSDTFIVSADSLNNNITFNITITAASPPTVGAVVATVAYNSSANPITLNITGPAATSVAVASAASHGTATASGTSITYTPTTGYAGPDSFTYTATNSAGTSSSAATVTITVSPPTIVYAPANPPNGNVGVAYSQSIATASGGAAPYTYTIASGALPAGVTLAGNGTLSGTPTAAGTFTFQVKAADSSTGTGAPFSTTTANLSLTITAANIALAPSALPSGTAGTAYSQTITATGGTAPYTYVLQSGTLPVGITLSSAGVLSGVSTQAGSFPITVFATDSSTGTGAPFHGTQSYTLTIASPTITLTPAILPAATVSTAYSQTLSASGGTGPYSFSETGNLPPGITLAATGTLSGTPTTAGDFSFTAVATDTHAFTGSRSYSVHVTATLPGAPGIGTVTPGDRQATVNFTAPASLGGDTGTITYTATSSPGTATGTSTAPGSITVGGLTNGTAYTFTVTATNSAGTGAPSAASSPAVTPKGVQTISFTQVAVNFGAPTTLSATTNSGLPVAYTSTTPGVCLVDQSSGVLTTKAPGNCTIDANQSGNAAWLAAPQVEQTFAIVVPGGAVTLATTSLPAGTGGTPYSATFTATGGATPYTYTETGALPAGLTMSSAGTISGTPTSAGTYPITVKVTDAATQTAQQTFQLTINAPGIALAPATLPQGKVAVAYTPTTLSASGGSAPYSYALTGGALPGGLTLSAAGVLSGTPTAAGSFNITVTATDKFNFQGTQAYTIAVGQPTPIVVDQTASTAANSPVTIVGVIQGDTGPITSLAITQQPAHGTATVSGLNIVYTPANNYFGSDALKYTATGPGGTSAPATVAITVVAGAVPVATSQAATVLAGKSVTIHAVTGATNGPFVSAAVATQPTSGTVVVQGTDLVYTATTDASGTFGFDYTVSNPFGASKPAHVTLNVNPLPVAPTLSTTVIAGLAVQVNLTATAHGGPFTGAKLVSITPANAGAATIQSTANGYVLSFTAAPTFGGSAQLTYTISNAFAESAPGTINVAVTPRSDPSKDAEVLGVLDAQADATRRMATGQISNFQRRLESLHGGGSLGGFSNGISMTSASSLRNPDTLTGLQGAMDEQNKRYVVAPDAQPAAPHATSSGVGAAPGDIAFWTGGAVNFGKMQPGTSDNGIDFTTSGVSFGADKQVASKLTLGLGVGYGHDLSDVGQHGSRSSVNSYNFAFYGSYQPSESTYIDAVIGYQWLQFDARRYVTDDGNTVHGSRDGKQIFGSFSVGYQHQADDMMLTPYGRLDIARASLDGYTETGDSVFALDYQRQTVKTSTATLGVLAQWTAKRDYGSWAPQLRAEFGHDMQGSSQATMRYADLIDGPLYQATLIGQSRNHTMLGAGVALQTTRGWVLRAEYQNYLDNTSKDNQSILLGVEKKFDP